MVRAGLALLGAAALGTIVLRIASTPILLGHGHTAVMLLSDEDPAVAMRLAEREFADRGAISEDTLRRVKLAAIRAPLAAEPYFLAATRVSDSAERTRLLEEARRRNPRLRFARLLLVDQYLRTNRIEEAAVEIKVLNRLVSEVSDLLVSQLARLAMDPQTRPALKRAVGNDRMVDQIALQLVRRGADSDLIFDIAQPRMAAYSTDSPPAWQRLLVDAQVERGDYREAFRSWQRLNRVEVGANAIHNPTFAAGRGQPPFNWKLTADATGAAEPTRSGGLEIIYFGRVDTELARQLILLPPGGYRLELTASSNDQAGGSRLAWQVSCAAGNRGLASIGLDELSSRPRPLRADFQVPATGCDAQWIRLVGEAAEFPTRREVQVAAMRLQPSGARP